MAKRVGSGLEGGRKKAKKVEKTAAAPTPEDDGLRAMDVDDFCGGESDGESDRDDFGGGDDGGSGGSGDDGGDGGSGGSGGTVKVGGGGTGGGVGPVRRVS